MNININEFAFGRMHRSHTGTNREMIAFIAINLKLYQVIAVHFYFQVLEAVPRSKPFESE